MHGNESTMLPERFIQKLAVYAHVVGMLISDG